MVLRRCRRCGGRGGGYDVGAVIVLRGQPDVVDGVVVRGQRVHGGRGAGSAAGRGRRLLVPLRRVGVTRSGGRVPRKRGARGRRERGQS